MAWVSCWEGIGKSLGIENKLDILQRLGLLAVTILMNMWGQKVNQIYSEDQDFTGIDEGMGLDNKIDYMVGTWVSCCDRIDEVQVQE